MTAHRPRVLIVVGYFDWFSGYQETALATALAKIATTEVLASDRVSPAFSQDHLKQMAITRRYTAGTTTERGVVISRLSTVEKRSMVWSPTAIQHVSSKHYDLIVQVMPGQLLSSAPTFSKNPAPKVVLYGDNRAMWAHLTKGQRLFKAIAFAVSKGLLYTVVNRRAQRLYGYTPDTLKRLRAFKSGRPMDLMPLVYSPETFFASDDLRNRTRQRLGYDQMDIILLAAGKFERRKRLDWLIHAFEQIAPENRNLHLLLLGSDSSPASREVEKLVTESAQADRITARRFVDSTELNAIFNASDLAIWPRNPAITIQQAMGTGLAVVLPRNGLVGHLIHPGCGTYYDLESGNEVSSLKFALTKALGHTDFSARAREGRLASSRWLSADVVAEQLLTAVSWS